VTLTPSREQGSWRQRVFALLDRLPTKWLISSVAALLLLFSSVLGGLDDAPVAPVPTLDAKESTTGTQLKIAVSRALLIDAFPEQGITPQDGNRLLVISATVENVWKSPLRLATDPSAPDAVVPVGVPGISSDTPAYAVVVIDDGAKSSPVQPGVPADLVFVWEVANDALAAGDNVRVDILDRTLEGWGFITYGERFSDPFVAAHVDLTLDDVGTGADQPTASESDTDGDDG
jgi:hypothetical protein